MDTPYFLINEEKIDSLSEDIMNALHKFYKKGIIGYSFKTNNLPWIIKYMKKKGMWAEVVSSDEYNLALKLGYDKNNIIFNGPIKGFEEFKDAIESNGIVNIDSKRELEWLNLIEKKNAYIGLRVNFDLEKYCPGETQCGKADGRFGFSYEVGELKEAIDFLKKNNIKLSGLHMHCSSKTRSINIYKAIAQISIEIVEKYNLEIDYIDIGGGFFGGVVGKPTFENYFSEVHEILKACELLKNINLVIEPGMSVVGAAIDYVTTVIDVKNTVNNKFIILDGSRIHIDPLMKKTMYSYEMEKKFEVKYIEKVQTLCGFTCMENDRFFKLENEYAINIGDRVIFKKVGAYTICLSPLFIQFFPDVYLKNKNNEIECVRKRWNEDNFI